MSVSGISASSMVSAYTPPVQQPQASVPQKASTSDVVNISNQARQLASDGDTAAQEARETIAVKGSELLKGVS